MRKGRWMERKWYETFAQNKWVKVFAQKVF